MSKFLSLSYWFNMHPGSLHYKAIIFFAVIIVFSIAIVFLFNIVKKRKNNVYFKIWRGFSNLSIMNIIVALFLLFFEYEEVYIFSARFLLLIWLTAVAIWLFFIFKDYQKIPVIKEQYAKEEEYKKYIP